jgi:UDP-glucose 4-epimerase
MSGRKVLITGGAGFIGSHLTEGLLSDGCDVVVLDNLANGSLDNLQAVATHPRFRFIKGDILNPLDCREAVAGVDTVFHLATLGVRHSIRRPFDNHRVNAGGTLRMLDASREAGVERFFYISSSEVYGSVNEFPVTETALPRPMTIYGASKLAGEHYARAIYECHGLQRISFVFSTITDHAHIMRGTRVKLYHALSCGRSITNSRLYLATVR